MAKVFAAMLSAGAYWFISGRTQEPKLVEEHVDAHSVVEQKPQITAAPPNPKTKSTRRHEEEEESSSEESDEEEDDEVDNEQGGD